MKLLALETSTLTASLALTEDDHVLSEVGIPPGVTHSRTLLPEIQGLLQGAGWTALSLDLIAVGLGPGSFTGLRIGLSVAKGLAWAAGKPLIGVPSLDALVMGAVKPDSMDPDSAMASARSKSGPASSGPFQYCPIIDARKNQVYAALYTPGKNGRPTRQTDYLALRPDELIKLIDRETVFVGEGLAKWGETLDRALGPLFRRSAMDPGHPPAAHIARRALELYREGSNTDPAHIVPLYVRPPDIRQPKPAG